MTTYEEHEEASQVLTVRNDRVGLIRAEVTRSLNSLHKTVDFNLAEILVAFDEIMAIQRETVKYLVSMK